MLCSRCKKRPAMVFITVDKGDSKPQGLCLTCAKEMGIKPLDDIMNKIGVSEEEVEAMAEQMSALMASGDESLENYDELLAGTSASFPFLKNVFSEIPEESTNVSGKTSGKKKKNKKKHLEL